MAKTVLVIDDDPTQRRLLTAAVEKAGFACRTAPDGETGVAIATDANAGADVVLLDLTMPGRYAFTREAHTLTRNAQRQSHLGIQYRYCITTDTYIPER